MGESPSCPSLHLARSCCHAHTSHTKRTGLPTITQRRGLLATLTIEESGIVRDRVRRLLLNVADLGGAAARARPSAAGGRTRPTARPVRHRRGQRLLRIVRQLLHVGLARRQHQLRTPSVVRRPRLLPTSLPRTARIASPGRGLQITQHK